MLLIVWGSAAVSGIGLRRVFLRSLIALPFALIALPTVFTKPGIAIFELDMIILTLTATEAGIEFFSSVLLKSWTSVTAAVLLTSTTRPMTLLGSLRWLRIPSILVAIVMLMYRYLFVLVDEAQRMLRARTARSAGIGPAAGGSILWRAKIAGGMAGSLFLRTLDRSERIYMAMLARGYDGRIIQARAERPLGMRQFTQIAVLFSVFVTVAALSRVLS